MNKTQKITISLFSACLLAGGVFAGVFASNKGAFFKARGVGDKIYNHYERRNPTPSVKGIREYWVDCSGAGYVFEEPDDGDIVDKGSDYNLAQFTANDERYIPYSMDEYHTDLSVYDYGARLNGSDFRVTYEDDMFKCNLYGEPETFKIELPRINFTEYQHVSMKVVAPDWYVNNLFGPDADHLSYKTVYGGNKDQGKIKLNYYDGKVTMDFYDIEYGTSIWFTSEFTDANIVNGLASAYFYVQNTWDRYLNISDFDLSCCDDDGDGLCTICGHLIDGTKLLDAAVSGTSTTTAISAPAGFTNVYTKTGITNGYNGNSANITSYDKLYFSLYLGTEVSSLKVFQGGDACTMWNGRWYNFLLTKEAGSWTGVFKEAAVSNWTTITAIDGATDENFSSLLRFYNWDHAAEVVIYCSEVYAA